MREEIETGNSLFYEGQENEQYMISETGQDFLTALWCLIFLSRL